MNKRVLFALAPLGDKEYEALMTQVQERVNAGRVTHGGKEAARGAFIRNKGGVTGSGILPAFARNAFVSTRPAGRRG